MAIDTTRCITSNNNQRYGMVVNAGSLICTGPTQNQQQCSVAGADALLTTLFCTGRCYRMMGHAAMVFNLQHIQHIEDKNLLSGHLLVLLGRDYQVAQVSSSHRLHVHPAHQHCHRAFEYSRQRSFIALPDWPAMTPTTSHAILSAPILICA